MRLLHSKLFRKNLYKWIFIYIGAISLFMVVVTYSKYITSMQNNDVARVAKFKVDISYIDSTNLNQEDNIYYVGEFRPTSNINYKFKVDTTQLEVSTKIVITILYKNDFNIVSYKMNDENVSYIDNYNDKSTNTHKAISVIYEVDPGNGNEDVFELTLKYNESDEYSSLIDYNDSVIVGYSAQQIK